VAAEPVASAVAPPPRVSATIAVEDLAGPLAAAETPPAAEDATEPPRVAAEGPELAKNADVATRSAMLDAMSAAAGDAAADGLAPPVSSEVAPAPAFVEAEGDADLDVEDGGDAAAWTDDALSCPRDWVAADGEGADTASPAGCRALAALIPAEAPPEEQAALAEAASEVAEELALLAPQPPLRRPEPPKRARYRSAPGGALPAPPDCGSKHAYWRYVDRRANIREWHCK
jgi:hypothetical protein